MFIPWKYFEVRMFSNVDAWYSDVEIFPVIATFFDFCITPIWLKSDQISSLFLCVLFINM
jgi:hypothetical protein